MARFRPRWAVRQVVGCLSYTGCQTDVVVKTACDPKPSFEGGILGLEPVQALRRADFLNIEKLEQVVEIVGPFAHVCAYKGADGLRAPGVDIAEKAALDRRA